MSMIAKFRREIFLAKNAGIRFRRGLRQPNIAREMSYHHFGMCEFEAANRQLFHARATYCFDQAAGSTGGHASEGGHTSSRSNRDLLVDECSSRARIDNEPSDVSIESAFYVEVMVGIQAHRNSRKPATSQETCDALAHSGTRTVWGNVKHLPRAIDNHPKLDHLACAEDAVDMGQVLRIRDMRSGSGTAAAPIHVGYVRDCHRDVCYRAIAQGDVLHFARAVAFPAPAKQAADV